MIKSTDIISDDLFDKQIKDSLKLAQSLEKLENDLKAILKTTEAISNAEAFKSYDNIKKVETDVTKLESALEGLKVVEDERLKLVKETNPLISKYSSEMEKLTNDNQKMITQLLTLNKSNNKQITTINTLNRQLSENKRRVDVLVNSNKALLSIQTRTTTQTIKNIAEYRNLNKEISKQETLNTSLKTDSVVTNSDNKNVNKFVSILERLKSITNSVNKNLVKTKSSIKETGDNANNSAKKINIFTRALEKAKKVIDKTKR
jgi:hypothetical protein